MNTKIFLTLGSSIVFSLLTGCVAPNQAKPPATQQPNQSVSTIDQILQQPIGITPQTTGTTSAPQTITLIDLLMQQLGLSQTQAQVGAGTLFQVAQNQMPAGAFSQLAQAVPNMGSLLSSASPSATAGSNSGNTMMALASAFQQQGLSPSIIPQMIPIVLQYVSNTGGTGVASALSSALMGR